MGNFHYDATFFVLLIIIIACIAKFYNMISLDTTAIIISMGCFTNALIVALDKEK